MLRPIRATPCFYITCKIQTYSILVTVVLTESWTRLTLCYASVVHRRSVVVEIERVTRQLDGEGGGVVVLIEIRDIYEFVPSIMKYAMSVQVQVVEEAIKYIDELHLALLLRAPVLAGTSLQRATKHSLS